jgi:hypothetical protein
MMFGSFAEHHIRITALRLKGNIMRIKRILITLLVALMMFSLVAIASAAEESDAPLFEIEAVIDSENAIKDGVLSNDEDGIELLYSVNVKTNPGIGIVTLRVNYDPEVLEWVSDFKASDIYADSKIYVNDINGAIMVILDMNGTNSETDVSLLTLKFKVAADFHGDDIESLTVSDVSAPLFVEGETIRADVNATQCKFEIHSLDSFETKEATCTTPGAISYTCSVCNEVHDVVTSDLAEHNYADATCTAPKTCTVCGATDGEALGHSWVDATCTDPKTCSVCQATDGEALGHSWVDATCTSPKTCSVCQATDGTVAPHTYGDWTQTKAPTTEEEGEETRTCSVCQNKETRPVEKLVAKAGSKGWIVAVVIIAVVVVCAGVVVGVVFYKQKKSY